MKELLQRHKQYLLTGVSHVIPFIACGGILIAFSVTYAFHFHYVNAHGGPDFKQCPAFIQDLALIGGKAFELFPAVLAGFIAYGMAGKPGYVPGFIGGFIASMPQVVGDKNASAGFLGALIIGLVAGHIVNLLKKLPVPKLFKPVMPIIIVPIFSAVPVGLLMLALNMPIAKIMVGMGHVLENLQGGSQVFLAMILGAMIAFDMGGPVNKAAFFFGAAMIDQHNYAIMGACAAAICTPPLGLGLATLLNRKRWTEEQRESGLAALGMGLIGITEGAIPFAAGDPFRVIPCIMFGSMVASTIAMLGGVGDHGAARGTHRFAGRRWPNHVCYRDHRRSIHHCDCDQFSKEIHGKNQHRRRSQIMKIVAVTACPTGIAHTYMAAEQLEKTAKKLGHSIKVETQGAMGIENKLTESEISGAAVAILAVDIAIEEPERFDRIRKIKVPVQAAMKNPEAIFAGI